MPRWRSRNNQAILDVLSESISGRFLKETGDLSFQGNNNLIVYRNNSSGIERTIVAEEVTVSEDSRYVYFRTKGRVVESIRQTSARTERKEREGKIPIG
jgi:hypothetical protein